MVFAINKITQYEFYFGSYSCRFQKTYQYKDMKITFIGGGNMGEAILAAVIEKGLSAPADICVGEVREERCQYLKDKYAVAVVGDNREAVAQSEIVVLAVKPQTLAEVLAVLKGCLEPAQLVLSIIAGARISKLS